MATDKDDGQPKALTTTRPGGFASEVMSLALPDDQRSRMVEIAQIADLATSEVLRLRLVKGIQHLGSDELFVQTTEDGLMRGYKGVYDLSWRRRELYQTTAKNFDESSGEFFRWKKEKNSKEWKKEIIPVSEISWSMTASAYGAIGFRSSVKVIDEQEPEYEYNPITREIDLVRYKLLFLGRDPAGNIRVYRLLYVHNPKLEQLEIIKAAILNQEDTKAESIRYGAEALFNDQSGALDPNYQFHPVQEIGGRVYGFCLDLRDRDALALALNILNIQKNAMKKGRTVAIRLGIDTWFGRPQVEPRAVRDEKGKLVDVRARITFYGWRHDPSIDDLESLRRHVEAGKNIAEWRGASGAAVPEVQQVTVSEVDGAALAAEETTYVDAEEAAPVQGPSGEPQTTVVADDPDDVDLESSVSPPPSTPPADAADAHTQKPQQPSPPQQPAAKPAQPKSPEERQPDHQPVDPKIESARKKARAAVAAYERVCESSAVDDLGAEGIDLGDALTVGATATLGRAVRALKKLAEEHGKGQQFLDASREEERKS